MQIKIEPLNLKETSQKIYSFGEEKFAKEVTKVFTKVAKRGKLAGQIELARKLNIRARNYILRYGVKGQPITQAQKNAFSKSFQKGGIATGAVYIRGAANPKNRLDFLMTHETGRNRTSARGGYIAVPLEDLTNKSYRTSTGKTRARYRPDRLLKDYRGKKKSGSGKSFIVSRKGKRGKKHYFIMSTNSTGRNTKTNERGDGEKIEFLYMFKKVTDQTKKMSWEKKVTKSIEMNLNSYGNQAVTSALRKL